MERDCSIDILRFIALSGIVLIHIEPSLFWCQLRSFDVPLMVLLSGVSYSLSFDYKMKYSLYCWKRFKRLVLPVWIYLVIYFVGYLLFYQCLPSLNIIVSYYTLMTGWYVWIIRVFFIVALFAPIIYRILNRVSINGMLLGLGLLFLLFECFMNTSYSEFKGSVYLLMNIPYIFIFALGCRLRDISNRKIIIMLMSFFLVYILFALFYYLRYGEYLLTQVKKYPPQLYYISYALSCCFLLWIYKLKIYNILPIKFRNICVYIGSHSMWIYLWYIPLISAVNSIEYSIIRYIIVYGLSVGITLIQNKLVVKMLKKINNQHLKKNINMIFVG